MSGTPASGKGRTERFLLPPEAVVVRAGNMPFGRIPRALLWQPRRKLWTYSIAAVPGLTADEIAEQSEVVKSYAVMSVGIAGELQDEGFPVESDGVGKIHGTILFRAIPDAVTWDRLRTLMPVGPNPHYRGK